MPKPPLDKADRRVSPSEEVNTAGIICKPNTPVEFVQPSRGARKSCLVSACLRDRQLVIGLRKIEEREEFTALRAIVRGCIISQSPAVEFQELVEIPIVNANPPVPICFRDKYRLRAPTRRRVTSNPCGQPIVSLLIDNVRGRRTVLRVSARHGSGVFVNERESNFPAMYDGDHFRFAGEKPSLIVLLQGL